LEIKAVGTGIDNKPLEIIMCILDPRYEDKEENICPI